MTKQQLIDAIIHRLAGGDLVPEQIGKFHPVVVEKYVDSVWASILYQVYRKNDGSLDLYTKTYSATVLTDTALALDYVSLPVQVVELPDNNGIRMISAKQDQSWSVPLVPQQYQSAYANMEISEVHDDPFAFVVGSKIYFKNLDRDVTQMLLSLVIPFSAYDDDDNVYIPSSRGMDLMDMVYRAMLQVPEEDMANDNNTKR